jgi:hypothetical protein
VCLPAALAETSEKSVTILDVVRHRERLPLAAVD